MKLKLLFVSTIFLSLSSCSNNSESDLINSPSVSGEVIKYSIDVAPIVNSNCIVCHAVTPVNGAPMSLVTYDNVKSAIQTRGLLDRISRAQGSSGMMPNGGTRLPQATIDKIIKWQTDGFVN